MGCSYRRWRAVDFYPEAKHIDDPAIRQKQIVRLIAKIRRWPPSPTLQPGHAVRLSDTASTCRQLPPDEFDPVETSVARSVSPAR